MGNFGGIVFALVFRFQPLPVGKAFWISGIIAMVREARPLCKTCSLMLAYLGHQSPDLRYSRATCLTNLPRLVDAFEIVTIGGGALVSPCMYISDCAVTPCK